MHMYFLHDLPPERFVLSCKDIIMKAKELQRALVLAEVLDGEIDVGARACIRSP